MRPIYFDYNATTPLDPKVRSAMEPFLAENFGNPSSIHQIGRRARAALDEARERVAKVLRCKPSEIVFTSGGTESNNLAIFGTVRHFQTKGRHLITSPTEHHAVLHCFEYLQRKEGYAVTCLPVDAGGRVNADAVKRALRPDTVLVSVMAANNEIGALQPVAEIGRVCREAGVLFHTDAVQWFGKKPLGSIADFNADLVSICGHKFHGPKGAGALFIRSPLLPDPILFGGGHENERRAGTENVPAVIGLAEAIERFVPEPVFREEHLRPITELLTYGAESINGVAVRGARLERLCNTIALTVDGCDSLSLLAGLDLEGICASSGSACSAGSLEPSHVLKALGLPDHLASSFVRFSLGRDSTIEEAERALGALAKVIERIRGN